MCDLYKYVDWLEALVNIMFLCDNETKSILDNLSEIGILPGKSVSNDFKSPHKLFINKAVLFY